MKEFFAGAGAVLWRILKGLPFAVVGTITLPIVVLILAISDLLASFGSRTRPLRSIRPKTNAVSIVIPNWNGRDLLEKYLLSVVTAAARVPGSEVIVVDNGSTDESAAFVASEFPEVRLLALKENLGFGGGSNAGFKAAKNDIVVLLNSDMRVDPDFVAPLLAGFTDEDVFAVSCQIFFPDPNKKREETGLTEGYWQQGALKVGHRIEDDLTDLYPCFYGGGGSCAFDRAKFLELGGFDPLYEPFYFEDTDLGYLAWKRGWKILYQPNSIVFHEHRGTIGKKFSQAYIQSILKRNALLFVWKNIQDWSVSFLPAHFAFAWAGAMLNWIAGEQPQWPSFRSILAACGKLGSAIGARSRARNLSTISDTEAFRRPLGGHFRDTFQRLDPAPERLSVLFVSPYPICPPVHGGGVFMYQTVRELAKLCDLHLIVLLDHERELAPHRELDAICASTNYVVRLVGREKALGSTEPHAPREFRNRDLAWMIHKQIYTHRVDVLQLEYLVMGQYGGRYRHLPSILFEHDVYFQSIARRLPHMKGMVERTEARWEYLRALRYELRLLPKVDRIQVCSRDNAEYLTSFLPQLASRIDAGYRAGINTSDYDFQPGGREPFTLLFLGSFRHLPNVEALDWFLKQVFPKIRAEEPRARLVIVGSDPPPRHSMRDADAIEMVGFVEDVKQPLRRYAVFVCPILAGSGVRVKLLEAFAAGIPVVSTRLGAEGLADEDGRICALADDPEKFAADAVRLLRDSGQAEALARRARAAVEQRDMPKITRELVDCYQREVERMRKALPPVKTIRSPAIAAKRNG